MSLSRIFDISSRSLSTYQNALDVTAHNVANSGNPDYSRQQVVLSTTTPQQQAGLIWGTGVKLDQIQRVQDVLIKQQLISYNSKSSDSSQRGSLLEQVQGLLSEPSDSGLSSLTTNFFNAWQQLSVTPNSTPLRYSVIQAAQRLSTKVQSIHDGLDTIKTDIINQVNDQVSSVNTLLKQIQSLNAQIYSSQSVGQNPNDLLDQRDKAISDLSNITNINVTYDKGGSAIISIGGTFAADRSDSVTFEAKTINGKLTLASSGNNLNANLTGGSLYALTDMYSTVIPGYQNTLDSFVNQLMTSVNTVHKQGYTLDNPPKTNVDFFSGYSNGILSINSDILADPQKIAVSKDGTAGNGDLASTISDLANQKVINGTTLGDYYTSLVSKIGSDKNASDQNTSSFQAIVQQLQQQKASVSGVSVDEEMTNIIKYQRAYTASAKLIKAADDMLQTLLNVVQ